MQHTEAEKIDTEIYTFTEKSVFRNPISRIVFHGIPLKSKVCGIYRINFLDHFYIGQSLNIFNRVRAHAYGINRHFCGIQTPTVVASSIINYLTEHKDVDEIHATLIEECDMFKLAKREFEWISKGVLDDKCLNTYCFILDNPSFFRKPILMGSNDLKVDLTTKSQVLLYKQFLKDLKKLKKRHL